MGDFLTRVAIGDDAEMIMTYIGTDRIVSAPNPVAPFVASINSFASII